MHFQYKEEEEVLSAPFTGGETEAPGDYYFLMTSPRRSELKVECSPLSLLPMRPSFISRNS